MSGLHLRAGGAADGRVRIAPYQAYDDVAEASAALVIDSYSSSFGLASRLLAPPVRARVRNVYALVRVADEIVDAPRPGAGARERAAALDALETETLTALTTGHSSNLVVHAFARTARDTGIDRSLIQPFFSSMRTDLTRRVHTEESFAAYIYGSAEVVGLMCLRAFVADADDFRDRYEELAPGARRLGAAFQKINFLRDLGEDLGELDRRYFPSLDPARLTDDQRDTLLDDIETDLRHAAVVVPFLPRGSRVAVCAVHDLFAELAVRLRRTPATVLRERRVRVPGPVKLRVVTGAIARRGRPRSIEAGAR